MAIITISRMFGSGGSQVAALVARRLSWPVLDNALVDEVAQRLNTTPAEVEAREERIESLAERLARTLALGSPEMQASLLETMPSLTEDQLLQVTRRVIEDSIASGPVVLVGRGAQCMLAERADVLHVFCCAPLSALTARAAERLGIPAGEARERVEKTNRDRTEYVRKHWSRSWRDPANYDLCVNTDALGVDGAAEMVLAAAQRKLGAAVTEESPESGQR